MSVVAAPPFMLALEYAARGIPVFPCQPRGKRPLTDHGFKDASTDPDVVREWWAVERWPEANIGTPTGLVFDVCDVDSTDALVELNRHGAGELAPVVRTSKGVHIYYQPTGIGNRAGFIPGCDWRGAGGYVIVPPSLHACGAEYVWESERTDDMPEGERPGRVAESPASHGVRSGVPGFVVGRGTLAGATSSVFQRSRGTSPPPVPDWLHALLVPNDHAQNRRGTDVRSHTGTGSRGFWSKFTAPKSAKYAAAALEAEARAVGGAAVGTRNDVLNRSTHTLARLEELDAATIEAVMLAAALDAGLPEHEARGTITSALKARGLA